MKVVLRCARAGLNFVQESGQTINVDPDEAGRMFASGQCSFVNDDDEAVALAAAEAKRGAVSAVSSAASVDDEDDSDAINGDSPDAAPGAEATTAIGKAKARRAAAAKGA